MADARPDLDHDRVCACADGHLVVTAPPGTGKTFLTARLAGLLSADLPRGSRILVLTFSNQARTQLEREARRQLTSEQRRRIEITNYHRFFWRGVLAYRRLLGLPMELDVGSSKRRQEALGVAVGDTRIKELKKVPGLLDALAEHAYPAFQDDRTPPPPELKQLLDVIEKENKAGRLVFDDLGALFWTLLEDHPAIDEAYGTRYPVVIADEHQDASALQDAIVRRFGTKRLIVFADEMQLIHGFRGARQERIDTHKTECGSHETLSTPHRWHGNQSLAAWLMAVRGRLEGNTVTADQPAAVSIRTTDPTRGLNGIKTAVKFAVADGFNRGHRSVAVLARTNHEVGELRNFLTKQGFFPRETGTADFEEAREDIEQLPLAGDPEAVVRHALGRLKKLLPTVPPAAFQQAEKRVEPTRIDVHRAGKDARMLLEPMQKIYDDGAGQYFSAIMDVITAAIKEKHHLPRVEAVNALRQTALALDGTEADLDEALAQYTQDVMAATQVAPRPSRGLTVMTAHQSKGKEFDLVVLAGASSQFFPGDDPEAVRLFYVAMTRATHKWVIIAPEGAESPLLQTL